jgi:UDP-N-acetyl-D-galactosamine dehydrogenase
MDLASRKIAIIGLGYVGLPLAVAFGATRDVVGFDINQSRVDALKRGDDHTLEASNDEINAATRLRLTTDKADLRDYGVFIVTVPAPIDRANRPDLKPLIMASTLVGEVISPGAVVIFESTVYPGCTEEVCAPLIEKHSGLRYNDGFFLGYSPEHINPGDQEHRLQAIVKVTSGSTPEAAEGIDALYAAIVPAGTHRTSEVPEAAGTKWNFLRFTPGLVGGHCIGVDPYYLTHKAQELGYHPEVILARRRINDGMGQHAADQTARLMMRKGIPVGSRILVMGAAFKENCPDLRNSKVADIVAQLKEYNAGIDIWDPWVDAQECARAFGVASMKDIPDERDDGVIVAVGHRQFRALGVDGLQSLCKTPGVIYDIKGLFPRHVMDGRF